MKIFEGFNIFWPVLPLKDILINQCKIYTPPPL